ncbi:MAG: lipoprotein insertase outer membrane protein LolB [Betaproteobacteria bacterium]
MPILRGISARAVAAVGAALLAACAPALIEHPAPPSPVAARAAFELTGRLSVRHGGDALAASFHWTHGGGRDELDLASPLGQTIARLSGDASGVRLQTSDGRVAIASDWSSLTTRALGWPLPVEGLAFWIQGLPRDGAPAAIEAGSDGMPAALRQDGWSIVYQAFERGSDGVPRPQRLTLDYPEVELRIAVDSWR